MTARPRRRLGGAAVTMLIDLVADARHGRRWFLLVVLVLVVLSAAAGSTAHYTVPWVVYGGL